MPDRTLYESLLKRKKSGEKLDWNNVTLEILERLFCIEILPDSVIAKLYEVEKNIVTKQRKKMGNI